MNLSKNFTLEELTVTDSGLANVPNREQIICLQELAKNVLQPLREAFGKPIDVNSGFRSFEVNKHANHGQILPSQHCKGEAADLHSDNNAELFNIIKKELIFDQLIWEGGNDSCPSWVHVSYKTQGNRGEVLRMKVVNGKKTYIRI